MQDATGVIKKLKRMMGIKTDLQLSEILDVKPNTISSWKKRDSLQYEGLIALCKEHKIDLNELFFSDSTAVYNTSYHKRKVKMISIDHHFEYFLDSEKTLATAPSYVFPTTEEVDTAFQVSVDNMYPTIKMTSYVITKRITLKDLQLWHIYLFILKDKGIVIYRFKRIAEDGTLLLISDNPSFENIQVKPGDVREVFCVRGAFLPNMKTATEL
ncbi:helix-turn-helix domain-containing protein [Myroides sp. N17-2]|uniref:LexA family transcriptional regulator n=1 Tax=Myroides sp. N17-2 TaxID=2030799 RepID=UPI000EFD4D98|nr:helix-turn-helix domain-containing protein [Myroides sp. N17-2]